MNWRSRLTIGGVALLLLVGTGAHVFLAGQNTHSSAAYLDVDTADGNVSENETVAFEQLSPAHQNWFERARNTTGKVEIPADLDEDVFVDNRYVRYQNRTYEVVVSVH